MIFENFRRLNMNSLFDRAGATLREKGKEKVQSIFGQQFALTFCTQESTEVLCLFSVYFVQNPVGTTANMYRHSVVSPY